MSDSVSSQLSAKATILLFFALLGLILAAGALLLASRPEPTTITIYPPPPTDMPMPTATPGPLQVYVTGAVINPHQVYTLPAGSRAADAVKAAGGFTSDADQTRINLARILRDADQIHVPAVGADEIELSTHTGGEKVPINSATQSELEALPGIGPVTAASIIEYREQIGSFGALDDLDEVPGIGPATLENLRDLVAFD
ncbi:MAG: ComEA family DNA-binding protein [Chloroflexi bacterium]|nr:ComEA family DNA-binding protein [Chloroflexota bacterium]